MQPKDATATKLKPRIPPKQEVKTDSFQGIQLKPVAKDSKKPQQAESDKTELKVALLKGIKHKDLAAISLCRTLYVFLNFSKFRFTAPNSVQLNSAKIYLYLFVYTLKDVSHTIHSLNINKVNFNVL